MAENVFIRFILNYIANSNILPYPFKDRIFGYSYYDYYSQ